MDGTPRQPERAETDVVPMREMTFDEVRALGHVAARATMPPTQAQILDLAYRIEDAFAGNVMRRRREQSDIGFWIEVARLDHSLSNPTTTARLSQVANGDYHTAFGDWLHDLIVARASEPSTMAAGHVLERQSARSFVEAVLLAPGIAAGRIEPPYRVDDGHVEHMSDQLMGAWRSVVAGGWGREISDGAKWWWLLRGGTEWPTVPWLRRHPAVVHYAALAWPDWFPGWWKQVSTPPPVPSSGTVAPHRGSPGDLLNDRPFTVTAAESRPSRDPWEAGAAPMRRQPPPISGSPWGPPW